MALCLLFGLASGCGLFSGGPGQPSKAIGMAFNFPPLDGSTPKKPAYFVRAASSVTWEDQMIVIPKGEKRIDYEGELVIVIGKTARRVSEEEAKDCILGYTCGMDGTPYVEDPATKEKDLLRSIAGKSYDGIAPIGPRIIPALDPEGHDIILRVRGQEVERANTKNLRWSPEKLVSEISQRITLVPGDVVFAGARTPVPQLQPGDVVEVEIQGIGTLRREVVAE